MQCKNSTIMKLCKLLIFTILLFGNLGLLKAGKPLSTPGIGNTVIVSLNDNVKSNYFPKSMIEEESGIPYDKIEAVYNGTVINVIKDMFESEVIALNMNQETNDFIDEIIVTGEDENVYSDLSKIETELYDNILDKHKAEYVLIINQHYLKWQETPLRTLFHFISYSVFDDKKNEVTRGSEYFTSMDLLNEQQLQKKFRKTSKKIASEVKDALAKNTVR